MTRLSSMMRAGGTRARQMSPRGVGVAVLVGLLLVALLSFNKSRLETELTSGDDMKAEFPRHYKVDAYGSPVKLAGVVVGSVTGVEETDRNTVMVNMRLEPDVREALGSEPSATIRPALVVGGRYYVELTPGGKGGAPSAAPIPLERTSVPVELDRVLSTVDGEAGKGMQGTIRNLDETLRRGGTKQVKRLLADSPETLTDFGSVVQALRGDRPDQDLTDLVTGLRSTAATLNRERGQVDDIVASLNDTSAALADGSAPLADAIADGPETLRVTREGLQDLSTSLDKATATADGLRPSARELRPVLAALDPVLDQAEPLMKDLNLLMDDARPMIRDLAPSVAEASRIFADVNGPVMDRINGQIADMVLNSWSPGAGPYEHGGNSHKFYEELGYLTVAGDRVFQTHDANGSQGRLMAGVGLRTLGGSAFPKSLEQYLEDIGLHMPYGPQEGKEEGGKGQGPIVDLPLPKGLGE